MDIALDHAASLIRTAKVDSNSRPIVQSFFDSRTNTVSYVVRDPRSNMCAIIDSVLDYDPASGRTMDESARAIIAYVRSENLNVAWHLETHVHADHLSAAPLLQKELGGYLAFGERIVSVQEMFGKIFNAETEFERDGSQFDRLFSDGDEFRIGSLSATVLHVPGHTPACLAYVIGEAIFVGDTLFMPDYGTARCDFPGGDARELYRSIQRLLRLPEEARVFVCHDYKVPGREQYVWETTIGVERAENVHLREGLADEEQFVRMRTERDATLSMPRLLLPSVQVNMRAGKLPPEESNGIQYLKIPVNTL